MKNETTRPAGDCGKAVAYVHRCFPSLTATFVFREIRALREAKVRVVNVACKRPPPGECHAEAAGFLAETLYLPSPSNPGLYLGAAAGFLRAPWRFIAGSVSILLSRPVTLGVRGVAFSVGEIVRGACAAHLLRNMRHVGHLHAPFSTEAATIAVRRGLGQ